MQNYLQKQQIILSLLLIFCLLSGCGSQALSASDEASSASAWGQLVEEPVLEAQTLSPEAPSPEVAEAPEPESSAEDSEDLYLPHEYPPEETSELAIDEAVEAVDEAGETVAPDDGTDPSQVSTEAPATSSDIAALETAVRSQISSYSGTWSLYFKNLSTGESFCINDSSMVAASLIKLYVYGAAQSTLPAGTYDSTLRTMISDSDNTACNTLIDAVGMGNINSFISDQSYTQSSLNRKMLASGTENYTSTSDCGRLLEAVYNGTYVSSSVSQALLDAMLNQSRRWKIPAGLPSGVSCANKTGELDDVENDVAIVYGGSCTYILCIMSDGISPGTAQSNIVSLSSLIYNTLN
jgi:beta-lactamase class A